MASSTGLVLAAGGIAAANEILQPGPGKTGMQVQFQDFNWRLVPATVALALVLGGIEQASKPFAVGLAGLILAAVLVHPVGTSHLTPLETITRTLGY